MDELHVRGLFPSITIIVPAKHGQSPMRLELLASEEAEQRIRQADGRRPRRAC
jgi:hypothetical protein